MLKRILFFVMVLTLAVTGTAGAFADRLGEIEMPAEIYEETEVTGILPVFPDGVTEVTAKTVPFYIDAPENKSEFTLYFMNGAGDLPFVNVEDIPGLLETVLNSTMDIGNRYTASIKETGDSSLSPCLDPSTLPREHPPTFRKHRCAASLHDLLQAVDLHELVQA